MNLLLSSEVVTFVHTLAWQSLSVYRLAHFSALQQFRYFATSKGLHDYCDSRATISQVTNRLLIGSSILKCFNSAAGFDALSHSF